MVALHVIKLMSHHPQTAFGQNCRYRSQTESSIKGGREDRNKDTQSNKQKHKLCSKSQICLSKRSCSQPKPSSHSGQAFIPRGIIFSPNLCNSSATLFELVVVSIHLLYSPFPSPPLNFQTFDRTTKIGTCKTINLN